MEQRKWCTENLACLPSAFVEVAAGPRVGNGAKAGDQVRRARQHQRDGAVEAERLDDGREEILEAVGSEMHVLRRALRQYMVLQGEGQGSCVKESDGAPA